MMHRADRRRDDGPPKDRCARRRHFDPAVLSPGDAAAVARL
jgi:hypothetical protein